MTLHILKENTSSQTSKASNALPAHLCARICDIMANCDGVLRQLRIVLERYEGEGEGESVGGMKRAARWALKGKEAERIRSTLQAHKEALGLVVDATTL